MTADLTVRTPQPPQPPLLPGPVWVPMPLRRAEGFLRRHGRLALVLRAVVSIGLLLGFMAVPLAFDTVITPPARVVDPVTIYLLDHGRTPSLVLPAGEGRMARYAYGDWNYYAMGNKSLADGILALFFPTRATLGRKVFAADVGRRGTEAVRAGVDVGIQHLYALAVERGEAERLRARLDRAFADHAGARVTNDPADLNFVPVDGAYTYFRNSNHVAARWLRELRCDTRGPAYFSRWRVEAAPREVDR